MPVGLPIGIDKRIAGQNIVIGVIAASFRPDKATLAAGINIPFYGLKDLFENSTRICFLRYLLPGGVACGWSS